MFVQLLEALVFLSFFWTAHEEAPLLNELTVISPARHETVVIPKYASIRLVSPKITKVVSVRSSAHSQCTLAACAPRTDIISLQVSYKDLERCSKITPALYNASSLQDPVKPAALLSSHSSLPFVTSLRIEKQSEKYERFSAAELEKAYKPCCSYKYKWASKVAATRHSNCSEAHPYGRLLPSKLMTELPTRSYSAPSATPGDRVAITMTPIQRSSISRKVCALTKRAARRVAGDRAQALRIDGAHSSCLLSLNNTLNDPTVLPHPAEIALYDWNTKAKVFLFAALQKFERRWRTTPLIQQQRVKTSLLFAFLITVAIFGIIITEKMCPQRSRLHTPQHYAPNLTYHWFLNNVFYFIESVVSLWLRSPTRAKFLDHQSAFSMDSESKHWVSQQVDMESNEKYNVLDLSTDFLKATITHDGRSLLDAARRSVVSVPNLPCSGKVYLAPKSPPQAENDGFDHKNKFSLNVERPETSRIFFSSTLNRSKVPTTSIYMRKPPLKKKSRPSYREGDGTRQQVCFSTKLASRTLIEVMSIVESCEVVSNIGITVSRNRVLEKFSSDIISSIFEECDQALRSVSFLNAETRHAERFRKNNKKETRPTHDNLLRRTVKPKPSCSFPHCLFGYGRSENKNTEPVEELQARARTLLNGIHEHHCQYLKAVSTNSAAIHIPEAEKVTELADLYVQTQHPALVAELKSIDAALRRKIAINKTFLQKAADVFSELRQLSSRNSTRLTEIQGRGRQAVSPF